MEAERQRDVMLDHDPVPGIRKALQHGGHTHTVQDVCDAIDRGDAQLWVGEHALIVTQIEPFPRCRALRFWLATGELDEVLKLAETIYPWAKSKGCDRAYMTGRKGWAKVLDGWTPTMVCYERKL